MNRAEAPDQLSAIDADHLAFRQPALKNGNRFSIAIALAERWDEQ